jgi:hypothetical protein
MLIVSTGQTLNVLSGQTSGGVIAKFGPPPTHVKGVAGLVGLFVNPWHN